MPGVKSRRRGCGHCITCLTIFATSLDTIANFGTVYAMKPRVAYSLCLLLLLAVAVLPVSAAEGDAVFLPAWVAWIMVLLALGVPVVLFFVLRDRGQL